MNGLTPFLRAVANNKIEVAKYLANECGANIAAQSTKGLGALHYCATKSKHVN